MSPRFGLRGLAARALVLLAVAVPASAAATRAIAAWWTDIGPQVMVANWTTAQIEYSYCNSRDTPVFPYETPNVLQLTRQPRDNTPLAGAGWYGSGVIPGTSTYASIFYQDNTYAIVNTFMGCNFTTGQWNVVGSWPISVLADVPSVNHNSGISVVLLGSSLGYRVFYHDSDMTVQMITYNSTSNIWSYGGAVIEDPQFTNTIASEFSGKDNITVVTPKDASDIEVARFNADGLWHISTFPDSLTNNFTWSNNSLGAVNSTIGPLSVNSTNALNFTLASYSAANATLGLTIDSVYTRSVWYIGTNKSLQQYSNIHYQWGPQPSQAALYWPQADDASAPLAATYNTGTYALRIYYYVNSLLTELRWDNTSASGGGSGNPWAWSQAQALPTYAAEGPSSSGGAGSPGPTQASAGLSAGARAGIGVGVTVGVLALGAAGAAFFFLRRRRAQQAAGADGATVDKAETGSGPAHGDSAYYSRGSGAGTPWGMASDGMTPVKFGDDFATNSGGTSPMAAYEPHRYFGHQEMATVERPQELEGTRPLYEMPQQVHSHEMLGEGRMHDLRE